MTNINSKRLFLSPLHVGGEELGYIHKSFESNYIAPLGTMADTLEKAFAEMIGYPPRT